MPKTTQRVPIPPDLYREVYRYYGGRRCVVSEVDLLAVDLHHVDEDPSNTVRENLVPLRADLNHALNRWKRVRSERPQSRLPPELDLSSLDSRSRHSFDRGHHRLAYGCARVGLDIARKAADFDVALMFASKALTNARAVGDIGHANSTLKRVLDCGIDWSQTTRLTQSRLLLEIGAFGVHHNGPENEWQEDLSEAMELLDGSPETTRKRQLVHRIELQQAIGLVRKDPGEAAAKLTGKLPFAPELALSMPEGLSNVLLWRMLARKLAQDQAAEVDATKLKRFLRIADGSPQPGTRLVGHTWWTRVEALLAFASSSEQNDPSYREASQLMEQGHIRPTLAIARHWLPALASNQREGLLERALARRIKVACSR